MTAGEPPARRPVPGVGVVVVDDRDRLLMVLRGGPVGEGSWSVPGGRVEFGETLREAAVREVMEETSLEVELGDVVWVGEAMGPGSPPEWHFVLVDFLGRVLDGTARAGGDARAVEWVPLDEVSGRPVTPTLLPLLDELRGG